MLEKLTLLVIRLLDEVMILPVTIIGLLHFARCASDYNRILFE